MATLVQQRCFVHPSREAASRCVECKRYHCRECVSDYQGRLVCAACLRKLLAPVAAVRKRSPIPSAITQSALGLLAAWFLLYMLGQVLMLQPAKRHSPQITAGAK